MVGVVGKVIEKGEHVPDGLHKTAKSYFLVENGYRSFTDEDWRKVLPVEVGFDRVWYRGQVLLVPMEMM